MTATPLGTRTTQHKISTAKRIDYATGYMALGMFADAAEELTAISEPDRFAPAALEGWVTLYLESGRWGEAEKLADAILDIDPGHVGAWCALARVTRATNGPEAAIRVIEMAKEPCGEAPALDFDCARYCLAAGNAAEARDFLVRACIADRSLVLIALATPELEPITSAIIATHFPEFKPV